MHYIEAEKKERLYSPSNSSSGNNDHSSKTVSHSESYFVKYCTVCRAKV